MRAWLIALAITSATFAGTTVYLAHQLSEERDRAAAQAPATAPTRIDARAPASAPVATAAPTVNTAPGGAGDAAPAFLTGTVINGQPVSEADVKKMQEEYSRNLLAQLADPERRAEMIAEYRMMMRNSYPRVDQVVGLSSEEYSRFLELMALQQIDMQEASAKCMVEPECRMRETLADGGETRKRELDALLGNDRAQKLETYKNTMGEREAVSQLRNRLPDAQRLSEEKAESLIAALAEERDLMHKDAARNGGGMDGFSLGAGMIFSSNNDGASFEERYESARQSSQRLRDRAAQFLNTDQLRAFNEMQDETLISLRSMLRNKDGMSFSSVSTIDVRGVTR